jgi:hypothetical protein
MLPTAAVYITASLRLKTANQRRRSRDIWWTIKARDILCLHLSCFACLMLPVININIITWYFLHTPGVFIDSSVRGLGSSERKSVDIFSGRKAGSNVRWSGELGRRFPVEMAEHSDSVWLSWVSRCHYYISFKRMNEHRKGKERPTPTQIYYCYVNSPNFGAQTIHVHYY